MNFATKLTSIGLAATFAVAAIAPATLADQSSRQKNKNNWRNGAILGGAAALYGLHNHDRTTTILGAAGAAYSAHRYEQDRHSQDQSKRARQNYHRARRHSYYHNGRRYYRY